ncbi:hypothetical protein [Thermosulfuriphilus sp.]
MKEIILVRPSLVLRLKDAFTGRPPHLPYSLDLADALVAVRRNRLEDLLLYSSGAGPGRIVITSPYYRRVKRVFSSNDDFLEIPLYPGRIYPFPRGSTVLSGQVVKEDESEPVLATVIVRLKSETIVSQSDSQGFFVLFPERISPQDLIRTNKGWLIPGPDGSEEVELEIRASGFKTLRLTLPWPLGRITYQGAQLSPEGG